MEELKAPGNGEAKPGNKDPEVKMTVVYNAENLYIVKVENYPTNEIILQGVFDHAKGFCLADLAQKKFEAMKNQRKIIKPGDPLQQTKDFLGRKH